jgi:Aldo/keto reductase family
MQVVTETPTLKAPAGRFTGDVCLNPVQGPDAPARLTGALVRFAPGARTNWHSHALGQTLHVTDGVGLVGTRDDTAEIYGPHTNEELVGRAVNGGRDQVVLATKFGTVSHAGKGPWNIDSSPSDIRTAVEGPLTRLGTDHRSLLPTQGRPEHANRRRRGHPGGTHG